MEKNDKIRDLETSNSNLKVVVKELNNQTDDLNGQIKSLAEQLARQAEEIEALKLKVQSLVRMIEKSTLKKSILLIVTSRFWSIILENEGSNMNCKSNEILKGFDENVQDYPIRSDPIQDENIDKSEFLCGDHLIVPNLTFSTLQKYQSLVNQIHSFVKNKWKSEIK